MSFIYITKFELIASRQHSDVAS